MGKIFRKIRNNLSLSLSLSLERIMKERKREGEFSTSLDRCYPRKGEEEEEEEYPRCP